MNFDKFLSFIFNKITVGILAVVMSVTGVIASNVSDPELNEINCSFLDLVGCVMCGCITPSTGCALMENCQILACDFANDSVDTCKGNCNEMFNDCISSMCDK